VPSVRAVLASIGLAVAIAGAVVATAVERLLGIGVLIVGAFLLVLPFTVRPPEE
jgi:uncharacterized membrane protein